MKQKRVVRYKLYALKLKILYYIFNNYVIFMIHLKFVKDRPSIVGNKKNMSGFN